MLVGSAPASLCGVAVSAWLRDHYGDNSGVTREILGVALIAGGFGVAAKMLVRRREPVPADFRLTRRTRVTAVAIGLAGGFVVGLTSIGTGVFFGLAMLIAFRLPASKVVGTDLFQAAALLWVAGAGHLAVGNVSPATVGWLLVGSIPGVVVGSRVSVLLPERSLRVLLTGTLIASGVVLAGWFLSALAAALAALVGGAIVVRSRGFPAPVAPPSRSVAP
jgi:uncharacterized membrane protein YfcA